MFSSNKVETIIKQKNSALSVFVKTKNKLEKVIESLHQEKQACMDRHTELLKKQQQELDMIALADSEIDSATNTIKRIDQIVGQ